MSAGSAPVSAAMVATFGADVQVPVTLEVGMAVEAEPPREDPIGRRIEQGGDFLAAPDVEPALLASLSRRATSSSRLGALHLAQHPTGRRLAGPREERRAGDLPRVGIQARAGRCRRASSRSAGSPTRRPRVPAEATAELVEQPAGRHRSRSAVACRARGDRAGRPPPLPPSGAAAGPIWWGAGTSGRGRSRRAPRRSCGRAAGAPPPAAPRPGVGSFARGLEVAQRGVQRRVLLGDRVACSCQASSMC